MTNSVDISDLKIDSLPNEEWRDVVGYEGLYMVSNLGRVKSLKRKYKKSFLSERLLNVFFDKGRGIGYLSVSLKNTNDVGRKRIKLHRLIANSFIKNPENKPVVNHINGIRNDNRIENLEWVSYQENSLHALYCLKEKEYNIFDYSLNEKYYIQNNTCDLKGEIWKDIIGYDGLYKISNLGRVKSCERKYVNSKNEHRIVREKILKGVINQGYRKVSLKIQNQKAKNKFVHRLIAETFIINVENYVCVNHIDGDKLNNSIDNLEWCSLSHNTKHSYHVLKRKMSGFITNERKRKKVAKYDLNGNFVDSYLSIADAAKSIGMSSEGRIGEICSNKIKIDKYGVEFSDKTAKGYMFRFFDDKPLIKIDRYIKSDHKKQQGIIVFDLKENIIGEFISIKEAAMKLNLTENGIYRTLRGEIKKHKGYSYKKYRN